MKRTRVTALSLAITGDEPPSEFRIFAAGKNETTKGTFLFDDVAAKSVMADYAAHGIDLMVDYGHASLNTENAPDPAQAGKAAGWFALEVRDGELWAVSVRWTLPAAVALRAKEWRFMSPAFVPDKDGRVESLHNVALTNTPATRRLKPLMAASQTVRDLRKLSAGPAFSDVQSAISAALGDRYPRDPNPSVCCDGPWIVDVFDATFVYQLDGKLYELAYVFDGTAATLGEKPVEVSRSYTPAVAPVANNRSKPTATLAVTGEQMDPKLIGEALDALMAGDAEKCMELLKGLVASAAGADPDAGTEDAPPPAGDGGADEPAELAADPQDPAKEEDKAAVAASISRMLRMTGATSMVNLSERVTALVTLESEHEKNVASLAKEKAAIELGKRKENALVLTKLGAETPHTTGLSKGKLCKRLLDEPIDEQNARVAVLLAARGGKLPEDPKPPKGDADGVRTFKVGDATVTLSDREVAMCADKKIDPANYAKTRAGIRARSHSSNGADR